MADFPIAPDFVFVEEPTFRTLVSEFQNGAEQRRSCWANEKLKFNLNFKNRPQSEYDALKAFFLARKGRYESFNFTNPNDSTVYDVRFDSDVIKLKQTSSGVYAFECDLIEVT